MHPGTPEIPSSVALEDLSKKVRKPYTITKSRESWTEQEHDKFLEALQLFDRDWKKIEAFVGSKSVIQIRSHAQKYFLKVQKNGTGEHVPPPRPKRKSTQPYPQKAVKTAPLIPISVSQTEPAFPDVLQPCTAIPVSSSSLMPAWVHHMAAHENVGSVNKKEGIAARRLGTIGPIPSTASCGQGSSLNLPQQVVPTNQDIVFRAMPDFKEVYRFLGSVFDPTANGHLNRMQEMAPIDRETVVLLMRNLSLNLSSSDFEEHKLFLSVYDMDSQNTWSGAEINKRISDAPVVACSPVLAAMS